MVKIKVVNCLQAVLKTSLASPYRNAASPIEISAPTKKKESWTFGEKVAGNSNKSKITAKVDSKLR